MKDAVRTHYAARAREIASGDTPSFGVGDPVELAGLRPGETVVDLGSGPGRDLLAAARIVGPSGRAIGVDMTPEMVERARASAADEGLANASVLEGDLEGLPLPCGVADAVISNCVINLTADKERTIREAYRVLAPGGRLAVFDTAFESEPPTEVREDPEAWSCCVGGALVLDDYRALLEDVGFADVEITFRDGPGCASGDVEARPVAIRASKPASVVGSPSAASVNRPQKGTAGLRPAVAHERSAIEGLLRGEELPLEGLRTEDAVVALDGETVVGAVALERHGEAALLRSLVVDPDRRGDSIGTRLAFAALEAARWSGTDEVYVLTPVAAKAFFERVGFVPVSLDRARKAIPIRGDTAAVALRLAFEDADLPSLGRPTKKELPLFEGGSCC